VDLAQTFVISYRELMHLELLDQLSTEHLLEEPGRAWFGRRRSPF